MKFNFEGWKTWVLILFLLGGGLFFGKATAQKPSVCISTTR